METIPSNTQTLCPETTRFTGKELAELLGVTPAALSDAIKHDRSCGGIPLSECAEWYESGRVKAYHVPTVWIEELEAGL